ncbi:hypothetical protein J7E91_24920 [Streptomyces sp. ISL-99]|uniref:hypothetical protein n=1 Tax=Streptomyces sp. ISL-99 TaxID=2819193 RepID=UPI001BE5333D|nr:hypothetical protein [Streptomyces sp. ISL-99]MBT2528559.1 hypothetical protein [Streptomyces sp. ISL-99]
MPQASRQSRSAVTAATAAPGEMVSVLLGTLLAVAVLLLCTDTAGGRVSAAEAPAAEAPVAEASVAEAPVATVMAAATAPASDEPGCRESHRDGMANTPAAPPRGGAAYELMPALHEARAGAASWGADALAPHPSPEHRPPPLDPPTPIDLSILRV